MNQIRDRWESVGSYRPGPGPIPTQSQPSDEPIHTTTLRANKGKKLTPASKRSIGRHVEF